MAPLLLDDNDITARTDQRVHLDVWLRIDEWELIQQAIEKAEENQRIVNRLKDYYNKEKWRLTSERINDDGTSGDWDEMGDLEIIQSILKGDKK